MIYTIEDLTNGKCAVINDGTVEELRMVLEKAFPLDNYQLKGYNRYYFNRDSNKFWSSNNLGTTLPSVSVKEFFKQITNKNMDELKITKEKVLEAAAKCSTAKATLQTLFPEVFEEDKYFDLTKLSKIQFFDNDDCIRAGFTSNSAIQVRTGGTYAFKGFYLTNSCNWEIVKDEVNDTVLIPTRKP